MKAIGNNSWFSWIATFALAIIGFFILIPCRLAGLFYVLLIDRYGTDRKHATIPIVIFGILRTLSGPLVGYLGEIFGLQAITLAGCIFAAVGVGGCYFAEDIVVIIVCLGFIYGYFREELGSYNWIYYIILMMCLFCGILVKFTPFAAAYRRKKNSKEI